MLMISTKCHFYIQADIRGAQHWLFPVLVWYIYIGLHMVSTFVFTLVASTLPHWYELVQQEPYTSTSLVRELEVIPESYQF
jgi:hypothetical protein